MQDLDANHLAVGGVSLRRFIALLHKEFHRRARDVQRAAGSPWDAF
jgi:hypothetical protein